MNAKPDDIVFFGISFCIEVSIIGISDGFIVFIALLDSVVPVVLEVAVLMVAAATAAGPTDVKAGNA